MTIKEYNELRYYVEKEYYFYVYCYSLSKKDEEKLKYFQKFKEILNKFEQKAIEKLLKEENITKESFEVQI